MQFLNQNGGILTAGVGALTAVTAAAATYYIATRPEPLIPAIDFENQSVELEDGSRISHFVKDGKLMHTIYDDVTTLHEGFKRGLRVSNNGPCLGTRGGSNNEYQWQTYQQVYDRAQAFGSGLIEDGLSAKNDTFIGIYSNNRAEWVIAEQACSMYSMVVVPLYDTLGADSCKYIINQIKISHVLCDKVEKAEMLLKQVGDLPSLKCIILMEDSSKVEKLAESKGVKVKRFTDMEAAGKKNLHDLQPANPSDLATICYTSGTTGDPKGAQLTHSNIISNMSAVVFVAIKGTDVNPSDRHLSYLPLAHMFERGMEVLVFMHGAQVGFSRGDVKLLLEDLQALKPSFFPTVPRLLNRIYDRVLAGVQGSAIKSALLNYALASKTSEIQELVIRKNSIWDKLIFGKIQQSLGGKVRLVITGAAPLEPKVLNFCRAAFGCIVMEGYGQTEASAGITFHMPGEFMAGHVGPPLPCCKVKLADVPEMEYYAKNQKGEICAKGPSNFIGYYKNPDKTKEALDEDGWLHTGDIGEWLPNGTLKIIDRKKNILKLAQGEYVATEKVENAYMRSQYVAQAYVDGNSLKPYLMGVMVPDAEVMAEWAKQNGKSTKMEDLCKDASVKEMILKDILAVGKSGGLKTLEQVKDIHLHPEMFSVENNLLTPTFKNKRPNLKKMFMPFLNKLYDKHEEK